MNIFGILLKKRKKFFKLTNQIIINIYIAIQRFKPAQVVAHVETFPLAVAATFATERSEVVDAGEVAKQILLLFLFSDEFLIKLFSGVKHFAVFKSFSFPSFLFLSRELP
jgi:hypothetical protein